MTQSLTDYLQESRSVVVAVDLATGSVRLRANSDVCSDLGCGEQTVVLTDEGPTRDLAVLQPGDLVRVEMDAGTAQRIVVVRRAWEELASPEL
jgi:hypothetical protein